MSPLYPSGAVDAKAVALYAGVDPDTVRKWRQRGLLDSVGGTARKPLYRIADVEELLARRDAEQAAA